jgi:hypothetical protein
MSAYQTVGITTLIARQIHSNVTRRRHYNVGTEWNETSQKKQNNEGQCTQLMSGLQML